MSVYIIAEAGVNHNGSFELACQLVDAAKAAGADCIKFQTFKAEKLVSHNAKKAEYQKATTGDSSQQEMLKKLELSYDQFIDLKKYCEQEGICFLSTPFDFDSIKFLDSLDMPFWKIPSGEITNYPYLVALAKTGKPVVMSTGMCEMHEIHEAISVLRANGVGDIKLLHCNTEYPTPYEDVNLNAMKTIREEYGLEVGYSDHTRGIEIPVAAVAMGATIIEKHFTLDRNMEGPDHKASLEPDELKAMVESVRHVEKALGNGVKEPSVSEKKNINVARKSIVASRTIEVGEVFSENNLTVKRPGDGISPMRWNEVIGQVAKRRYEEDEQIEL
ncbi:MAG: N-acetylneuraminate synthase [Lachnospiraceae bacterium]|nr:N-acetylneuraminate synthase [Lachnospiraceae bacterium]